MNMHDEFRKYAMKDQNIGSLTLDRYSQHSTATYGLSAMVPTITNLTPNIIEERRMNAVAMDVFSRLMMDRIIFLGLPIDDQVANIIQAQLLFLESTDSKKDVIIYVNSPGGSVYAGLGIYDTMHYVRPEISTVCTGLAASMGAVLLAGGTKGKRAALPHARIMIHQPLGGAQGQASDIEIVAEEIRKSKKELYDILAKHTGQPYDKIWADADRDNWMRAAEAKEYGLIDEVLVREPEK